MRLTKLYLLIAPLGALVLAMSSCQSAQRPVSLLPPAQSAPPALTQASSPPQGAAQQNAASPARNEVRPETRPDPVADLLAKVEKEYAAGIASSTAGHADEAKRSFDKGLTMLASASAEGLTDERLQQETDKLLEAVNALDQSALQQGEGSAEQKSEPAPIDEANDDTTALAPVDPTIKAKAEAEVQRTHSDLPLMLNDTVAGYINYFSTRGRDILERGLARSGQYDQMIRRTLRQEGVPEDLIYLAQAESGFKPFALSRAGARGMWQFMALRAKGYGLQRDWWVDERQDPEKATRAAARHLKDLYAQFGDWYLAMAAYNSGPGTVQNAVKRTGYADFWELYKRGVLPRETRNYVPIILAVTIMAKNPSQYGLDEVVPDPPLPADTVKIDYPVDLRLVAQCIDGSAADLQDLNPSLLRLTTPRGRPFELRLPAGSKEKYLANIAPIPRDMRVWWRYHTVQEGDTLTAIAKKYRTTANEIERVNHLDGPELTADSKLIVPIAPGKHARSEDPATYARRATRYRVHRGDTVFTVAERFGVPPEMVRRWNRLKSNSLHGRRVVYVHLPITRNLRDREAMASASRPKKASSRQPVREVTNHDQVVRHKVKPGETLFSIARLYQTTVDALTATNGKIPTLQPGMILIIHGAK
jgi:membrane-bound lytic murein transglycosylase D